MGGAINIKACKTDAGQIVDLWHKFAEFEALPSMVALGYPPHFTFAIYDEIDPELLDTALGVFSDSNPISIRFTKVAWFETNPLVVWLAPANTAQLIDIHKAIHTCIDPQFCREYYRPAYWVPHCTLAMKILPKNAVAAKELALQIFEPFDVCFDVADYVTFPPLEVGRECALGG